MTTVTQPTAFATACDLYDRGQLRDALPYFQQALHDAPDDVNVLYRTALTLVAMRDYSGAARWLQQLLPHVDPTQTPPWLMGGLHYNLGVSYESLGQWSAADRCHRNALAFDPSAILPKISIGSNCYRQGKPDEGKTWHDQALEPATVDVESRPARSFLKLLRGDYRAGFHEYEARWKLPQVIAHSHIPTDRKRWKGKPLDGQRILVVGEQGIGDTLLMARYVPMIEAYGGRVDLLVNRQLHRLFRHNFPNATVLGDGDPYPQGQWWAPMLSLPYILGTTPQTVPSAHSAYLHAGQSHIKDGDVVLRVGWVERGNPLFMGDHDRSAPAGTFAPLLTVPDVTFFDLSERADRKRGFTDMADTAALVASLDLVITVDTAIGHLAGSLGVPCWLLPMTSLHWLWGMPEGGTEHRSNWYPHHRLYRRTRVDAWPEVIQRVRTDLVALALQRLAPT